VVGVKAETRQARPASLIGTALYGAVCRVVWDRGANHSPGPDWLFLLLGAMVNHES
jgi:hypothetical protein